MFRKGKKIVEEKLREKKKEEKGIKSFKTHLEGVIKALGNQHSDDFAIEALVKIGEPAVEPLIKALDDSEMMVRHNAAKALGKIGDERAIKPLIDKFCTESQIMFEAEDALAKIGEPTVEPLIKALDDNDFWMRAAAVGALGKIGDERAVEPLMKALNEWYDKYEKYENGCHLVAKALGAIGDERAVEPLIEILDECSDEGVRWHAATALGEIGDLRAFSVLERATNTDTSKEVRRLAGEARNKIKFSRAYKEYLREQERKKPDLQLNILTDTGFKVGVWQILQTKIMNVSEIAAKNVKLTLSGPIEKGPVKPIPKLGSGEKKEIMFGIKPTEHGNLPLDVSLSYTNEDGIISFKIEDIAYIYVAKETETVSMQPQTIFNIGSIGEVLSEGAIKTGDVGIIKGGIGSTERPFSNCPYCGEGLNLPKTPKYCPYCGVQLR